MLMTSVQHETRTGGLVETAAFKVEMNAMMFHSVIDGIYADKIRAPFRELTTNARDGHAAKGNLDQPFDVYLPSMLDPTFKVRDYGISLSHEEIMGIYSTMFASSKRDSNTAVGMIGLGSKSPFAYTSVFTVIAYLGDYKRTYSAFIGEDGVPQIALLDMCETTEPDGVEVSFPVKIEDVDKFRAAAPDVLFGFDPFPNVLNEQFVRPVPEILYKGDGWTLYNAKTVPFGAKLMARQGCVLYPISSTSLSIESSLFNWPVVIDFPIGDLSVATSREALGYDSRTIANIIKRIDETTKGMAAMLDAEVNAASTYLEACQILHDGASYNNPKKELFELVGSKLTYDGKPLRSWISCDLFWRGAAGYMMTADRVVMGTIRKSVAHRTTQLSSLHLEPKKVADLLIYVEFEGTKFGPSRMRQAILDNDGNKDILWIRARNISLLGPFIEKLGNPDWIDLGVVPPLKLERAAKTQARMLQYISPVRSVNRAKNLPSALYDTVIPTDDMIYVRQQGAEFFVGPDSRMKLQVHNIISELMEADVIPRGTKVYLLNKAAMKILDEVDMQELSVFAKERLTEMVDVKSLRIPGDRWQREARVKSCTKIVKFSADTPVPAEILDVCQAVLDDADEEAKAMPPDSPLMTVFKRHMPRAYEAATKHSSPVIADYHEMLETYPLLDASITIPARFTHYMELLNK